MVFRRLNVSECSPSAFIIASILLTQPQQRPHSPHPPCGVSDTDSVTPVIGPWVGAVNLPVAETVDGQGREPKIPGRLANTNDDSCLNDPESSATPPSRRGTPAPGRHSRG